MVYSMSLSRTLLVAGVGATLGAGPRRSRGTGVGPSRWSRLEQPGQRLSSIVGVAVGEYGKGVDERGQLILG